MSPGNDRGRPRHRSAPRIGHHTNTASITHGPRFARCTTPTSPNTFGLTPDELWAEAQRLVENGWSLDEVRAVLELPVAIA